MLGLYRVAYFSFCPSSQLHHEPSAAAINLRQVTIQADGASEPTLDNVTLDIKQSQIAACAGPTGAGKSLLAKTMLGEVYSRHGTVTIASRRIGYCDQTPWLPNGSIRDVICKLRIAWTKVSTRRPSRHHVWYMTSANCPWGTKLRLVVAA